MPAAELDIRNLSAGYGQTHVLEDISFAVPAGGRLEVQRGTTPVKWARLGRSPFTDRLVRKFRLPVTGWRGQ